MLVSHLALPPVASPLVQHQLRQTYRPAVPLVPPRLRRQNQEMEFHAPLMPRGAMQKGIRWHHGNRISMTLRCPRGVFGAGCHLLCCCWQCCGDHRFRRVHHNGLDQRCSHVLCIIRLLQCFGRHPVLGWRAARSERASVTPRSHGTNLRSYLLIVWPKPHDRSGEASGSLP